VVKKSNKKVNNNDVAILYKKRYKRKSKRKFCYACFVSMGRCTTAIQLLTALYCPAFNVKRGSKTTPLNYDYISL